ncbi:checkpoint clamp complex protein Rad1 [Hypoxylon texense]
MEAPPERKTRSNAAFIGKLCGPEIIRCFNCSPAKEKEPPEPIPPPRLVLVAARPSPNRFSFIPKHARLSFFKTATPRWMKKTNGLL